MKGKISFLGIVFMLLVHLLFSQGRQLNWMADGSTYTKIKDGNIVKIDPKTEAETLFIKKEQLTVNGKVLKTDSYMLSNDNTKLLLFVNTQKVWRYNTKGDYWILDLPTNKLTQIGKGRPAQSLMFAKFSPDAKYIAAYDMYIKAGNTTQAASAKKYFPTTQDIFNYNKSVGDVQETGCWIGQTVKLAAQ